MSGRKSRRLLIKARRLLPVTVKTEKGSWRELLTVDQSWGMKPGLLRPGTSLYDPLMFSAAEAGFFTVEKLRPFVHEKSSAPTDRVNPDTLSRFFVYWARCLGAVRVGIYETRPYHFYTHRGRGRDYGRKVETTHKYAIAVTVEMGKIWWPQLLPYLQ